MFRCSQFYFPFVPMFPRKNGNVLLFSGTPGRGLQLRLLRNEGLKINSDLTWIRTHDLCGEMFLPSELRWSFNASNLSPAVQIYQFHIFTFTWLYVLVNTSYGAIKSTILDPSFFKLFYHETGKQLTVKTILNSRYCRKSASQKQGCHSNAKNCGQTVVTESVPERESNE